MVEVEKLGVERNPVARFAFFSIFCNNLILKTFAQFLMLWCVDSPYKCIREYNTPSCAFNYSETTGSANKNRLILFKKIRETAEWCHPLITLNLIRFVYVFLFLGVQHDKGH